MTENSGVSEELVNWCVFSKENAGVTHTKVVHFQKFVWLSALSKVMSVKPEMFQRLELFTAGLNWLIY